MYLLTKKKMSNWTNWMTCSNRQILRVLFCFCFRRWCLLRLWCLRMLWRSVRTRNESARQTCHEVVHVVHMSLLPKRRDLMTTSSAYDRILATALDWNPVAEASHATSSDIIGLRLAHNSFTVVSKSHPKLQRAEFPIVRIHFPLVFIRLEGVIEQGNNLLHGALLLYASVKLCLRIFG